MYTSMPRSVRQINAIVFGPSLIGKLITNAQTDNTGNY